MIIRLVAAHECMMEPAHITRVRKRPVSTRTQSNHTNRTAGWDILHERMEEDAADSVHAA